MLSASEGNADVQYNLGLHYKQGNGLPQNWAEAYFWLSLAAKAGNADAASERDAAGKELSREQKSAVERRVKEWRPTPTWYGETEP